MKQGEGFGGCSCYVCLISKSFFAAGLASCFLLLLARLESSLYSSCELLADTYVVLLGFSSLENFPLRGMPRFSTSLNFVARYYALEIIGSRIREAVGPGQLGPYPIRRHRFGIWLAGFASALTLTCVCDAYCPNCI